jgi:hypothetical protein
MPRQLDRQRKRPVHCFLSHYAAPCALAVWIIAGGHPRLAMQHHGHGLRGAAAQAVQLHRHLHPQDRAFLSHLAPAQH